MNVNADTLRLALALGWENVMPAVFALAFALIVWGVYRWVHSWSSTAMEWVFVAIVFLFSASAYVSGERPWWVLGIAAVSGGMLALGAGYVIVLGIWRATVALVAKMTRDVRQRIEHEDRSHQL